MKIEGVIAATVTPFTKDGVNYGGLKTLLSKASERVLRRLMTIRVPDTVKIELQLV